MSEIELAQITFAESRQVDGDRFESPRCRRVVVIPSTAVPSIPRVNEIQALGVTIGMELPVRIARQPSSCITSSRYLYCTLFDTMA